MKPQLRIKRPDRMDWADLLADLKRAGISIQELAKHIGYSEYGLRQWMRGDNLPRYDAGAWIVAIHADVMAQLKDDPTKAY